MWSLNRASWKQVNRRNKVKNGIRSLPRASLLKLSTQLNSRVHHSENWFDKIVLNNVKMNWKKPCILRKNYPIANRYFADYFIMEKGIVIEIDESSHSKEKDDRRDADFESLGLVVHRVKMGDLFQASTVLKGISEKCGSWFILAKSMDDIPPDHRSFNEQVLHGKMKTNPNKKKKIPKSMRINFLTNIKQKPDFNKMLLEGLKK